MLVLYRQMDRQNRSLDKVHRYANKLKDDIALFVSQREGAIRDYGAALEDHQKTAGALLKQLQSTDTELAQKVAFISKVDERINEYDKSLEELIRLTNKVQNNLNGIREQSSFVEGVDKRLGDSRNRLDSLEKVMTGMAEQFEQRNHEILEKIADTVTNRVQIAIEDFESRAETLERRVEDHRTVLSRVEDSRATQLEQDIEFVNRHVESILENAALRADKLEDTAVVKLREQAQSRVHQLYEAIESELDHYQETAQQKLQELQNSTRALQDEWKQHRSDYEAEQQNFVTEIKNEVAELHRIAEAHQIDWEQTSSNAQARMEALRNNFEQTSEHIQEQVRVFLEGAEQRYNTFKAKAEESAAVIEQHLEQASRDAEQRILEVTGERFGKWEMLNAETDNVIQMLKSDLEAALAETKIHVDSEINTLGEQVRQWASKNEEAIRIAEERVLTESSVRITRWEQDLHDGEERIRQVRSDLENAFETTKKTLYDETTQLSHRLENLKKRTEENTASLEDKIIQLTEDAETRILSETNACISRIEQNLREADTNARMLIADWETTSNTLNAQFNEKVATIDQHLVALDDQVAKASAELKEHIDQAARDAEEQITLNAESRLVVWQEALDAGDAKTQALLAESENRIWELENRTEESTIILEEKIAGAARETDARLAEWQQALEAGGARTQALIAESESRIWELKNRTDESTLALEEKISETARVAEMRLAIWQQALNAGDAQTKALEEKISDVAEEAGSRLEMWQQAIEEGDKRTRTLLTESEKRVHELEKRTDETALAIQHKIAQVSHEAEEHVVHEVESRLAGWRQAIEESTTKTQLLFTESEKKIENLDEQLVKSTVLFEKKIEAAAHNVETRFIQTSESQLAEWQKALEVADTKTQELLVESEERIRELENRTDEALVTLEERIIEVTKDATVSVESQLSKWQRSLEESYVKVQIFAAETEKKIQEIGKQADQSVFTFEEKISELSQYVATTVKSQLIEWQRSLEESDTKVRTFATETQKKIQEVGEQVDQSAFAFEEKIAELSQHVSANVESRLREWQKVFEESDTKVQTFVTETEQKIQEIEEQVDQSVFNSEEKITELSQYTNTTVESQLTEWQRSLEESDKKIQTLVLETQKKIQGIGEQVDQSAFAFEEKITELSQHANVHIESQLGVWEKALEEKDKVLQILIKESEEHIQALDAHTTETTMQVTEQIRASVQQVQDQVTQEIESRFSAWQ
ncbi:MAG: hypothetical protein LBQ77_07610, partial [Treponema sp.]|nr:hypothetical protein [Treponema sp.]